VRSRCCRHHLALLYGQEVYEKGILDESKRIGTTAERLRPYIKAVRVTQEHSALCIKVPIKIVMLRKVSAMFVSLFIAKPCWSNLPLTIEDLLTEKNEFRVEFGLNYANANRKNVNTRFDSVQVGPENFILLPVDVRNQRQNSDVFALTLPSRS